jgi:sugar lactone lactonase YvrE
MSAPAIHRRACLALPALLLARPAAADPLDALRGRVMVDIADGDFLVSTYLDGRLAPEDGRRDVLRVTTLGPGAREAGAVTVSNSVTATPESVALSPDGRFAFVVERLGTRPTGATLARDLPAGHALTAVDLRDPAAPRLNGMARLAAQPESVRMSADGRFLAVPSSDRSGPVLQIIAVSDGALGPVTSVPLRALGLGDAVASFADWHPAGDAIALNLNTRNEVLFLRVAAGAEGQVSVQPWGAPVPVGRDPFVGRFTPDGRHYLTADWGRDFSATTMEGRLPTQPSTLSVVQLDAPERGTEAIHRKVAEGQTDRSSEGIAISPDGRLVATVNMRETAFPPGHPRHTRDASISLLRLDPATGALTRLGETLFEGVLPEGACFDATGEHLVVAVYAYPEDSAGAGGLEVFRVENGAAPRRIGRIPAPPGTHHVEIR